MARMLVWACALVAMAGIASAEEPVIGGPCEGCRNVFVGMPDDLTSSARIAPPDEPGEALVIEGTVTRRDGKAAAGIIVYAYHTDAEGIYPDAETRHGRLRGWALTDASGHYRFDTIRPASYPNTRINQHVHMHVIEPGVATYYIGDLVFDDDPLLSESQRERYTSGRGGSGLGHPEKDDSGEWRVRRDITLGKGVPGYPGQS